MFSVIALYVTGLTNIELNTQAFKKIRRLKKDLIYIL